MSVTKKNSIITALITICVLVSAAGYAQQSLVPDSVLHRKPDLGLLEYPAAPWTPGCDSIVHPDNPRLTYYYNVDSIFNHIATRPMSEIRDEVHYLYFIMSLRNQYKLADHYREKLLAAIDRYQSDALRRELDVFDTYCYFQPGDPEFGREWDYFWKLVEKYDRKGDLQTKMRIMERLLFLSCGYQAEHLTANTMKGIPTIQLIDEILDTQQRLDERGEYYLFGAAHFYCRVGLIYYYFSLYDKALPLFWKAARMPFNFYQDRGVMTARDYLGDYYFNRGDYDRSDSLYLTILYSPEQVHLRHIDDLVAFGKLAASANCRGQTHEAIRILTVAIPQTLEAREHWLATIYSVNLARIYLDAGEMDKAKLWIDRADEYYCNGRPRTVKWVKYYELCRDYFLRLGNAAEATHYMDSVEQMNVREQGIRNTPIMFEAHQQAYQAGLTLKEQQLRTQRSRVVFMLIILSLSLLISGILLYFNRRLQAKNRDLFKQIKEQDLLAAQKQELLLGYHSLAKLRDAYGDKNSAPKADELAGMRQRELFVRLRGYLLDDRNFARPTLDSSMLIAALSTNRNYLFEAIKTFTGKTLQEYINDLRLEEAKQMLETSDATIENIGMQCGYSSVRTFYRLFRAKYNISPALYRKLARER